YQMKRQQEQDTLRASMAEREAKQQEQQMQLQAAIHGMRPQGVPSRIRPELNAIPLPDTATVSPESDLSNAEPIPGARQRHDELQAQEGPGLTIGDQR